MFKERFKEIIKSPTQIIMIIAGLLVIIYFGILIYNQIGPKTNNQKKAHCLELSTNVGVVRCLEQVK